VTEMAARPEKCVHYWIIEPPHGPTSKGRCRYCGTVAEFFNDLQGFPISSDSGVAVNFNKSAIVLPGKTLVLVTWIYPACTIISRHLRPGLLKRVEILLIPVSVRLNNHD
jgi:hypothetical protein